MKVIIIISPARHSLHNRSFLEPLHDLKGRADKSYTCKTVVSSGGENYPFSYHFIVICERSL